MTNDSDPKRGFLRRLWSWLWRPSARWSLGTILAVGGIAGIIFWGGFNTFMEYTNTEEFCVSCHEMRDNVGVEWKQSAHYKNASGVRAICSDCHVPKDWTAKLWRKIQATNELYHHLIGTIDTPEKFEAKRAELAERVWAAMKANDSRECRNCHSYEAMDFHKQTLRAQEKMREGLEQGKTCIECHTGIAHKRPPRDD
ncbi:MAG: NapC/NirT family cytochrome c [Proteobacteria bacterium]|nr:NapC/NirT family cytochrome c [Pseudomonadota bacterium]MCH8950818.1 NapC/NirT family cytochrome c [Pseudomonadota bacterium]